MTSDADLWDDEPLLLANDRVRQLVFDLDAPPALGEEDFIVSEGNGLAFAHVMAFPEWAGPLTLIVGPAKAGKTHLGTIWRERAGAETATPDNLARLAGAGGSRPVLVEDADRAGYDEVALFHLLNGSMRAGRPVLMTARTGPGEWPLATDDVRSRARLAAQFQMAPPDDTQLSQMFVKLFGDRQIKVDPKLIAYLVSRMERSPQEAVMLVRLMDRLALEKRGAVTRAVAARAIALRAELHEIKNKPEQD